MLKYPDRPLATSRLTRVISSAGGPGAEPAPFSVQQMGQALGLLYVSGGALALLWTFMPRLADTGDEVVRAMAVLAIALGAALRWRSAARFISSTVLHATLAAIQIVIAVAYVAGRSPDGDIRLFFLWATPFAALYVTRGVAALHVLWTVAALAGALLLMPPTPRGDKPAAFVMTVGCLLAVGALVSWASRKLHAAEAHQRHAASHDAVSGLAKRFGFTEEASLAIEQWRAAGGQLLVAVLDLDRFKLVNDTHGHAAGDQLLAVMAPRLRGARPQGGEVARLGGDEFAILWHDLTGRATPADLAARLGQAWAAQVDLGCVRIRPSGSLGITVATDPRCTAASLLTEADTAMYRAKADGPGDWALFDGTLRASLLRRMMLEESLAVSLAARSGFRMAYQPVVALGTGRWVGAEALLRWSTPALGEVSPAEFVPLAEECGLAVPLGELVMDLVLEQLASWNARHDLPQDIVVGVNVSARQLTSGFAATIADALSRWKVPVEQLAMEVTETALLGDPAIVAGEMNALHRLGISLLLDDFGTGYSSLTHVRRFPISTLKIDRSFVSGEHACDGHLDQPVVSSVLALASSAGYHVIAEGVETLQERDELIQLGCQFAQGWLFAKALEPADFCEGLLANTGRTDGAPAPLRSQAHRGSHPATPEPTAEVA